ncbi:MAG: hypothetical protein KKC05_03820 [Nanoarchaeota archaeon]|nr:hypothetical protein [Nanoarchaeota archaeon]
MENLEQFLHLKENNLAFIKGVEDGDGYVMKHRGCIEIGITTEKKFQKLIISSLSRLYKNPKIEKHYTSDKVVKIYYMGLDMALKFFFDRHFENHPQRYNKLIELIHEFMRRDLKYLKSLREGNKTVRDIEKEAMVTYRAANIMMKKYIKSGFVISNNIYLKKTRRFYSNRVFKLSDKGNILVNEILKKEAS